MICSRGRAGYISLLTFPRETVVFIEEEAERRQSKMMKAGLQHHDSKFCLVCMDITTMHAYKKGQSLQHNIVIIAASFCRCPWDRIRKIEKKHGNETTQISLKSVFLKLGSFEMCVSTCWELKSAHLKAAKLEKHYLKYLGVKENINNF